ncbi:hypothetical protein NAT51_04390 [Flavobacterium amniphilum]|uniref:hypothetical protein n=1 Tax=Flavobacterium amniphilum TaxID=1834035 RepID=UPI00202A5A16|nr:hypothetical protein [Flavobacterium amniphilum]MCL9804747.1 hypothetical protein [Flavobacterium amniphilum]
MKIKILNLLFILGLLISGCSNDDSLQSSRITEEDITNERKIDASINDVDEIIEGQYLIQSGFAGRTNSESGFHLPSCATVTSVLNGTNWTLTIDFGTEGCELSNGNILKGKIIFSFTNDFETQTKVISYTFENFYHNDVQLNGNRTLTRTRSNTNGNPETSFNTNLTLTLGNGDVYTRTGTRTTEWTEGHDTPNDRSDDVHLVTGNWSTTSPNGTMSATITTPLKKLGNCHYYVEGVIVFTKNDSEATLDFGDGECDNQATLTINGEIRIITL